MAAGRPIVATDIPGNRAVIKDRHSGLLVPPGDSKALCNALDFMLENPGTAGQYAQVARTEACSRFDIRHTVASLKPLWTTHGVDCRPC